MSTFWRRLTILALVYLALAGPCWAGVPRVVMVEDFTATW